MPGGLDLALGKWFTGGLGSALVMVGLDGLRGLFQPEQIYNSIIRKK